MLWHTISRELLGLDEEEALCLLVLVLRNEWNSLDSLIISAKNLSAANATNLVTRGSEIEQPPIRISDTRYKAKN